jgi:hypothetical protein
VTSYNVPLLRCRIPSALTGKLPPPVATTRLSFRPACGINRSAPAPLVELLIVVEFAVINFGRGPAFPSIWLIKDVGVCLAVERGLGTFVVLEVSKVFQEQQPG